ncbi:MAG: hypothetical protein DDT35_00429 [Firmicutes bacterium]|nr:hypothetical protein [Bacillota bacterium]
MDKKEMLQSVLSDIRCCSEVLMRAAATIETLFGAEVKTPTLEDVRAVLAEKSREGHTAEIRLLLERYGAPKLSQIDPSKYVALLEEVQVLGRG